MIFTLGYRYALGCMHGVASQEKQEYSIQDQPAVIHIASETAPFVAKKIRDKRMTE